MVISQNLSLIGIYWWFRRTWLHRTPHQKECSTLWSYSKSRGFAAQEKDFQRERLGHGKLESACVRSREALLKCLQWFLCSVAGRKLTRCEAYHSSCNWGAMSYQNRRHQLHTQTHPIWSIGQSVWVSENLKGICKFRQSVDCLGQWVSKGLWNFECARDFRN